MIFRVGGKSSVDDYTLAAEACLPIISAILAEIRNQAYPQKCFLNIDLPTDVANNKVNPKLPLKVSLLNCKFKRTSTYQKKKKKIKRISGGFTIE